MQSNLSLNGRRLVLASSSPRRQYLMNAVGFLFSIEKPEVEEIFPAELPTDQVARYLAELKAEHFRPHMRDEIVVTADTVVILNDRILNKPSGRNEAITMLGMLSGKTHKVMTGVSIISKEKEETFDETTYVTFEELSRSDIEKYVDQFEPYDKAGAYGAQDTLPPAMNPCSPEEVAFMESIGNRSLVDQSQSSTTNRIVIIRRIDGSYFNVMGLPVHKVYAHLTNW